MNPRPLVRRRMAAPAVLAAVVAALLVPLVAPATADTATTPFPGTVGTVVLNGGDGLVPTVRYNGENRFDTARLIAEEGFHPSETVLLARGGLFPDSLSGNFLAGQLGAPILLTNDTPATTVNSETMDALEHVGADNVIILGGAQAVSPETQASLVAAGYDVDRVGGIDRFETAALIASEPGNVYGNLPEGRTAIVASGENFPDALVAGAISYAANFPLLLTNEEFLTPVTDQALSALAIDHVLIVGGENAVGSNVEDAIEADGMTTERVGGPARIETAVALAQWANDNLGWSFEHLNFATGTNFPDALTIGPHAGDEGGAGSGARSVSSHASGSPASGHPILLTNGATDLDSTGNALEDFLAQHGCEIASIDIAGGEVAISRPLELEIRERATAAEACALSLTPESATNLIPETATILVAESHTVTANVTTNGGGGVADELVRFEVWRDRDGDGFYDFIEAWTDYTGDGSDADFDPRDEADGEASFTYGSTEAGHDVIVGCVVPDGGDDTDPCPASVQPTDTDPLNGDDSTLNRAHDAGCDATGLDLQACAGKDWVFGTFEVGALMDGLREVNEQGEPDQGDPDGNAFFDAFLTDVGAFCWYVDSAGLTYPATGFHIHEAPPGENGPVVLTLTPPAAGDEDQGCVNGIDQELLDDIRANPGDYYANLHTGDYPNGAVRGQLVEIT